MELSKGIADQLGANADSVSFSYCRPGWFTRILCWMGFHDNAEYTVARGTSEQYIVVCVRCGKILFTFTDPKAIEDTPFE